MTNINKSELLKEDLESFRAKSYFSFLATAGWIENSIKEALKPFNITHAQLNALYILVQNHPEPIPANTIKEKVLTSNPDVTRLLDRLVKKGWVVRETCPDNRRKVDITITDSGIELFEKAHFVAKKAVRNYFEEQLTEEEAIELRTIARKMRS